MAIIEEIDAALFKAVQDADRKPSALQFIVALNTEARNEFMREMLGQRMHDARMSDIMSLPYRGAVLAVTDNETMPRVSVFSRPIQ